MWKVLLFLFIYCALFGSSFYAYKQLRSQPVVADAGRLLPVAVKSIEKADGEETLRRIVEKANETGDKLTIAGMQHSQGGQTYYPEAVMIDMKSYNKIIEFDPGEKTITVQSGATWDDIQRHINPYGLAVKVMQSQNIFTIGGSLSVNVHGRDIRNDSLIHTIESFRLLTPRGEILNVSSQENADLFPYIVGGYGLFGVILDVTLHLTDDELYERKTSMMDYSEYSSYFEKEVKGNPAVKMHLARISVAPETFLREMYVTDYIYADNQNELSKYNDLKEERIVALPKFLLGLSRYSDWGKNFFWDVQKKYMGNESSTYETRNNVMRSDTNFMNYESSTRTEVLQEYFVPVDDFLGYVDDLRSVLEKEEGFNLLNITIRYVEKSDHAVLSYAKEDMFALVLLINQEKSENGIKHSEAVIQKMIDVTLNHNGSYYLPYYLYPSKEQLAEAYPRISEFFEKKKEYDSDERFTNYFYEEYK
ncbi:FAD-binding oxidoreductase [Domibacillus aminovorans]|uniref:FAD-binding protein n=1 Tax=Domibacillus aminovorans TaxID=29332 RepID=A0A177L7D3_9BACI|nr:FAD-binding oxidoreductase [Domibacillus aminovorans]OAH61105.1 FAD-binding protein [Domibacillus aminovorans]